MRKDQGRLPFEYVVETKEARVTSFGGLPLVAEAMTAFGVDQEVRARLALGKIHRQFDAVALVRATVLLMAGGGDCLDDIERLREDEALCELLGGPLPSPATLRNFLYAFHNESLVKARSLERARVPEESESLRLLQGVVTEHVAAICDRWKETTATVDIDGTIIESHKKEALPHYEGGRGYQPLVAYWAETGLAIWDQFRDGNVPGHLRAYEAVRAALSKLPAQVTTRKLRGDTAHYSPLLLQWLVQERVEFAIGAKKRAPLERALNNVPDAKWLHLENRPDTELSIAELSYRPRSSKPTDQLRYLGIRMRPLQHSLLDGNTRRTVFLAIVTNSTAAPADVVRWYWAKAGTIEKLHDVVKNELAGGVMPCGRFGANAAWFRLALLAHNVLQTIKRAGPELLRDARPKRLRFNLFAVPVTVARHARTTVAKLTDAVRSLFVVNLRQALWTPIRV